MKSSNAIHFAEGIAKVEAKLVGYSNRKGDFVEAVANSLRAIHLFDSLHLTEKKIDAQLVLSTIYKEMGGDSLQPRQVVLLSLCWLLTNTDVRQHVRSAFV